MVVVVVVVLDGDGNVVLDGDGDGDVVLDGDGDVVLDVDGDAPSPCTNRPLKNESPSRDSGLSLAARRRTTFPA